MGTMCQLIEQLHGCPGTIQRPAHIGGEKAAQMPKNDALAVKCIHGRRVNTADAAEKLLVANAVSDQEVRRDRFCSLHLQIQ